MGIDGGGSKTEIVLAEDGREATRLSVSSCKMQRVGREQATAVLNAGVKQVLSSVGSPTIAAACIGLSGASDPQVLRWAKEVLSPYVQGSVLVEGDHTLALEAAFSGGPGIVIVAGTGSICVGRDAAGHITRCGGNGPLVSDEGSGQWIVRTALGFALRAGYPSRLTRTLADNWRCPESELVTRINQSSFYQLAELFPLVLEAATNDDVASAGALASAGTVLAEQIFAVQTQLWPMREAVTVAYAGGVLQNAPQVRDSLSRTVIRQWPNAMLRHESAAPVEGALFLARQAH